MIANTGDWASTMPLPASACSYRRVRASLVKGTFEVNFMAEDALRTQITL